MDDSRQEAKAEAAAAKARSKAMRPWYRKKRILLPAAFVALAIVGALSGGSSSTPDPVNVTDVVSDSPETTPSIHTSSDNSEHPPSADVKLTKCGEGSFDVPDVEIEVTNHSSKRSSYIVTVSFEDASGVKAGDATDFVNNVEAGQVARSKPFGTTTGTWTTCRVTDVNRTAD